MSNTDNFIKLKQEIEDVVDRKSSNLEYEDFVRDSSLVTSGKFAFGDVTLQKDDVDNLYYIEGNVCKVYYFHKYNIYVKFIGSYTSYCDYYIDEMREVTPVTKTINTFE